MLLLLLAAGSVLVECLSGFEELALHGSCAQQSTRGCCACRPTWIVVGQHHACTCRFETSGWSCVVPGCVV
jgi:hypothetical protein